MLKIQRALVRHVAAVVAIGFCVMVTQPVMTEPSPQLVFWVMAKS